MKSQIDCQTLFGWTGVAGWELAGLLFDVASQVPVAALQVIPVDVDAGWLTWDAVPWFSDVAGV